jgi:hypothetical protein
MSGITKSIFGTTQQTGTQTATQSIDPMLKPYVEFGLQEGKNLYLNPTPYAPFQTYVDPSSATTQALSGIQQRATSGSSLIPAAQAQLQKTITGDYLSAGNPFFQGAFQAAARPVEQQFGQNIMDIRSKLSSAGRYGSGAQTNLENRAATGLSTALSDIAGKMSYQNYGDERTRQTSAMLAAPEMAMADYSDLTKLLGAGQLDEQYEQAKIADQLARYQYAAPESRLGTFLSGVYQAPAGSQTSQPIYGNPKGEAMGTALQAAATAAMFFSDVNTKKNITKVGSLPNGLNLYTYEYKDEFKDDPKAGHGLQFGVLAHEVEKVIPEAVSVDKSGYKVVNYSYL